MGFASSGGLAGTLQLAQSRTHSKFIPLSSILSVPAHHPHIRYTSLMWHLTWHKDATPICSHLHAQLMPSLGCRLTCAHYCFKPLPSNTHTHTLQLYLCTKPLRCRACCGRFTVNGVSLCAPLTPRWIKACDVFILLVAVRRKVSPCNVELFIQPCCTNGFARLE